MIERLAIKRRMKSIGFPNVWLRVSMAYDISMIAARMEDGVELLHVYMRTTCTETHVCATMLLFKYAWIG